MDDVVRDLKTPPTPTPNLQIKEVQIKEFERLNQHLHTYYHEQTYRFFMHLRNDIYRHMFVYDEDDRKEWVMSN